MAVEQFVSGPLIAHDYSSSSSTTIQVDLRRCPAPHANAPIADGDCAPPTRSFHSAGFFFYTTPGDAVRAQAARVHSRHFKYRTPMSAHRTTAQRLPKLKGQTS